MQLRKKQIPVYFDLAIITLACFLAFFVKNPLLGNIQEIVIWKLFLITLGINVIILYFSGGYYSHFEGAKFDIRNDLFSITKGIIISFAVLAVLFLMNSSWRNLEFFQKLGVSSGLIFVFLYGIRYFEYRLFYFGKKVVVIILMRNHTIFDNIKYDLINHASDDWYIFKLTPDNKFQLVYDSGVDEKGKQELAEELSFIRSQEGIVNNGGLNAVVANKEYVPLVVTDQTASKEDIIGELLVFCYNHQIPVFNCFDFYEKVYEKALIFSSDGKWFWDFSYLTYEPMKIVFKTLFDFVLASFLLPLIIVPGVLIGVLIKMDSKGPIFFIQDRAGLKGKVFRMFKFRTMIKHPDDSEQWPKFEENLVTRFGNFLRKTGFDEIPQLINIFRGEMSFVGPRPARPTVADMHCANMPFFALTHSVMPGIAGWAQLHQGQDSGYDTILERVRYNVYYMKHYSIFMDLYIILKTVKMAIKFKKPESTHAKVKEAGLRYGL